MSRGHKSGKHSKHSAKQNANRAGNLNLQLGRADQLMQTGEWDDAADLLEALAQKHPNHRDVWAMLGTVYYEFGDRLGLWAVSRNMVRLEPNEPDNWFNIVNVAIMNIMPFTAVHYAKEYLARFPTNAHAPEIRKHQEAMEQATQKLLESENTEPGATAEDFMELEQSQIALNGGYYDLAEELSYRIIQRNPQLAAPRNNLSLLYGLQAKFPEAIATARQVLETHPGNIHALSNLIQLLLRNGQVAEAEAIGTQLEQQTLEEDHLVKQIEGLTYLRRDSSITRLFEEAEKRDPSKEVGKYPALLYHLVAVAYAWQGDIKTASHLWQQALKENPALDLAQANLENLKLKVGERTGAFPFHLFQWVPMRWGELLLSTAQKGKRSETALKLQMDKFLQDTPGLSTILPILFERGDEQGRQFALQIAQVAVLPALCDFALSENGTDAERMQAAQLAAELGMLPRGKTVSLLMKGARTEIMLFGYKITTEPDTTNIPKNIQKMILVIHSMLGRGEFERAEARVREALELAPDQPTLWNYLTVALNGQGKTEEVDEVTRQAVERFPDYLFARTAMAQLCTKQGNFDEARRWLEPLISQETFHISEFKAFAGANIDLALAQKEFGAAESWVSIWEQLDPDDPNGLHYRQKLITSRFGGGLNALKRFLPL